MTSSVLRAILAVLLIATVAGKFWSSPAAEADVRAAVLTLIELKGWSAFDQAAGSPDPLGKAINFQAPECEGFGQVFPIDLGLQLAPMIDRVIEPGYTRRFVYIGRTWPTQDRFGLRLEWLKNRVLSLFGLGRYVANETVLVIAEPNGCHTADQVNWSEVWKRPTRGSIPPNRNL